jgi:hypothetical protein
MVKRFRSLPIGLCLAVLAGASGQKLAEDSLQIAQTHGVGTPFG